MSEWYVVWCKTNSEDATARGAEKMGAEALVPKGKFWFYRDKTWELKEKIYIPGYVFIKCDMNSEIYYGIRALKDVMGWLGSDSMWPTRIEPEEMDTVIKLNNGTDPEQILKNIKNDRHRRKASGTLTIGGEEKVISFAAYDEKQPDENKVDKAPLI